MDDLVQFLRARLDEDQEIARKAASSQLGGTHWERDGAEIRAGDGTPVTRHTWAAEGAHITRHDPARVLAEVDAKRRILALHRRYVDEPGQACLGCAGGIEWEDCPVVRLLTLPYRDHPDYRPEWAPDQA